ncbi:hypothetical protein BU24DRAFT_459176 [Aaosphaeria arxii CBS 175.79]|uniref:Tat pathway signal sequence n=1 Tax=Aaosphaeria arxii CBS 175.79 TaxID=1450172 RepID=A0A6A5Y1Y4_9PLEO|nr:uncharacterized protein BU24DRAFT_459176 [Aaosphaeria arxii CBS 175.79]KAF2019508.1 hypothetical protein BU24DRAFT_459176 [Aaosphaeria arxii CBS 175.79]
MADFLDYKIQFKDRPEWSMGHYGSGFNAPPSDELDDLWEDLLEAKNIRISPEEVRSLDTNLTHKVRVNDGDYVGVIGAYHQLHCLNIIRRLIHWDYYGPRMSEEERESFLWKQHHSDHCLEVFRQSIMCHAYPSFYLGEWVADSHEFPNIELMAQGSTKCVDWDSLDTWARKRKLVQGHFKTKPGPYEKSASKHQKHG